MLILQAQSCQIFGFWRNYDFIGTKNDVLDVLSHNLTRDIMNMPFDDSALDHCRDIVVGAKEGHKRARHKAVDMLYEEILNLKEKYNF